VARILLAEGNSKFRSFVKALVETKPGCHICGEAVDAADAVKKIAQLRPDLVVLDFATPGAAAKIAAFCPKVPIILYGCDSMTGAPNKIGIRELVSKGDSGERLLEAIEKH
jgi:DNA-binding NarL/FixJ family response regulator